LLQLESLFICIFQLVFILFYLVYFIFNYYFFNFSSHKAIMEASITDQRGNRIHIGGQETFPSPLIVRSAMIRLKVRIAPNMVESRVVMHSGSGRIYEIGSTLKKAIFGQVVRAVVLQPVVDEEVKDEYIRTNQQMAIKIYSKRILRQLQGRTQENPLAEITALQYIGNGHPNIMGQVECCTDEENIYSIMNYCPGGELFDYIDENGPMNDERARHMFRQLISALCRLQELGMAHRDLSLENILYDGEDGYMVIDFGMCVRLKKHNMDCILNDHVYNNESVAAYPSPIRSSFPLFCWLKVQSICGKINYIAPEVLRQDPYFNPMLADIWAAGVILFILLTGVPPIDQASEADERYLMVSEGRLAEMIQMWRLDVRSEAIDLIQRILHPDPTQRLTLEQMLAHPWMHLP
jgi:serine/threonine protein kinase